MRKMSGKPDMMCNPFGLLVGVPDNMSVGRWNASPPRRWASDTFNDMLKERVEKKPKKPTANRKAD